MNVKEIDNTQRSGERGVRERLQHGAYGAWIQIDLTRRAAVTRVARGLQLRLGRRLRRHGEFGAVSVETVAWFAIAFAIVGLVGGIVTGKLQAMANSLPSTLDW